MVVGTTLFSPKINLGEEIHETLRQMPCKCGMTYGRAANQCSGVYIDHAAYKSVTWDDAGMYCCTCEDRGSDACGQCFERQQQAAEEAKRKAEEEAKRKVLGDKRKVSDQLQSYMATPGGTEMKAWLLQIGTEENDIGRIVLQFLKPKYEVKTLRELFALDDGDIDEILQDLPLAKKKLIKKSIKQEQEGE
jgi:hypothetical protein